jgi:phosphoribosylanthranilate isomerase
MDVDARIHVKVCGITDAADARAAMAAGADLLGFIFFPKSPRYVPPERVRDILSAMEPSRAGVLTVGVFVDEASETVLQILEFCGLDLAQLHGDEPPAMLGLAGDEWRVTSDEWRVTGDDAERGSPRHSSPVTRHSSLVTRHSSRVTRQVYHASTLAGRAYKALRPRSAEEAADLAARYALPAHLRAGARLPALLVDAYHPHLRGGTGETADWRLAADLAEKHALLLAGGLTPANVAQAVEIVRPWGVDVSSGVEAAPGHKDHAALHAFIQAIRSTQYAREARSTS